uniref:NADH-ubiquinone oxidoreductase chain 6 n=1 Tax=Cheilinus fasciatus TaxID=202585 RepID=A0A343CWC1_9LABR|nr:NADH dehydrogenase subunit 6 [Cheilinus fasciatus]ARN59057.1 NADH dehydrogenase subunit 6 [Cheilinus fasciatus]
MAYVMSFLLVGLVIGLVAVASNPSPYFAALGLVVVAGVGCGILAMHGGSFLSLVLFLIYLGGMLVVFAYSAALAAEPYPETWFSGPVGSYIVIYMSLVVLGAFLLWENWYESSWLTAEELEEFSTFRGDMEGVALMYEDGGGVLWLSAWALLLTLFVVLELTRGLGRGTVRAV